jgi:hypothetical protein
MSCAGGPWLIFFPRKKGDQPRASRASPGRPSSPRGSGRSFPSRRPWTAEEMTGCQGPLTAEMPGTAFEHLYVQPAATRLRDLACEVAALPRALHSWPVPKELSKMLRRPEADPDPIRRAGSELVLLPPSAAFGLIPVARQRPFMPRRVRLMRRPVGARLRRHGLERTIRARHGAARDLRGAVTHPSAQQGE